MSYMAHKEIYDTLSGPLKRMQIDYLERASASCYKEKHMADDVPNEEQVKVCRDRIHEKVFGKFFTRLVNVRDSAQFKFTDCLNEAGNEYE